MNPLNMVLTAKNIGFSQSASLEISKISMLHRGYIHWLDRGLLNKQSPLVDHDFPLGIAAVSVVVLAQISVLHSNCFFAF